jgi:hypothetical protein
MKDRRLMRKRHGLQFPLIVLSFFYTACLYAQASSPTGTAAPNSNAEANQQPNLSEHQLPQNQTQHSDLGTEVISAVVGALAGAFLGGVFGWKASIGAVNATEALARAHEKEQAANLRQMLRAEIDFNLSALQADQAWRKDQPEELLPGQWVALHPAPAWSTVVWENSVLLLAKALKSDEVLPVHQFYTSLRSLTSARQVLEIVWRESEHPQNDYGPSYEHVLRLESEMLKTKNPISVG